MGYNGSNRRGIPQKGSGFSKSSMKFGSGLVGGFVGLIGLLFGPFGILLFFIAIFNFDAFIFIIGLFVFVFIIGVLMAICRNSNDTQIKKEDVYPLIEESNNIDVYNYKSNDNICSILNRMSPYPKTYKRIARKCIRVGSKVKRKSDGEILYVVDVLKYKYKCYDFTIRDCIFIGKEELVTD